MPPKNTTTNKQSPAIDHSSTTTNSTEVCPICSLQFNSINDLVEHNLTIHDTSSSREICNVCGKSFIDIPSLLSHAESEHQDIINSNNSNNTIDCTDCIVG